MNSRPYKQGKDRLESAALPKRIEDFVGADNPVLAIDAYVETLNLAESKTSGKAGGLNM